MSITSDRSTNPGISAPGLVGGGRWWLSMRGDIERKSPCWFQWGPLLTLFQKGSMHVQTPFTPLVFQSLSDSDSSPVTQKRRYNTLTFCLNGNIHWVCCFSCTNGAVNYVSKHKWLRPLTSMNPPCPHLHWDERGKAESGRKKKNLLTGILKHLMFSLEEYWELWNS